MKLLQNLGLALLIFAITVFILTLGLSEYKLSESSIIAKTDTHKGAILKAAKDNQILDKTYSNSISFVSELRKTIKDAQAKQLEIPVPEGVSEWDHKIGDWEITNYVNSMVKPSTVGIIKSHRSLIFLLTFGLGVIGALCYIIPLFAQPPGIKNNGIYHSSMTRGLKLNVRTFFIISTMLGVLVYGVIKMGSAIFLPLLTLAVIGLIYYLVIYKENQKMKTPPKSASPDITGWVGVIAGTLLIIFYVLLYWTPEYITNWIILVNPISKFLSGNDASQWFLYGLLYTIIVIVMGIRMISKYRHNTYQIIRTLSVMFFQLCFAFLIPEVMARLKLPYYDFKNIWPLNYTFFFDYNINNLIASGGIGIFMLVWGIVLALIGVPILTYFFGKRWYCSWVCGCGGLAETMGDPYRQLSDKSLRAWKYERYIIHGVLVFAVIMTIMVLYSYFTGSSYVLFMDSNSVRSWYGFLIGSAFAGVVGTGFYPLMGNRTWCRFGCPLAAYLGLVQRFKSRFRITTNGGQCISCGNCSTYCEMGIDVRAYAQRGQDIVRSSCVGCGICSAVCPRGVLRLENGGDINKRTEELRTIHISEDQIKILS